MRIVQIDDYYFFLIRSFAQNRLRFITLVFHLLRFKSSFGIKFDMRRLQGHIVHVSVSKFLGHADHN